MDYGFYNTILGHFTETSDKIFEPEWIAPEVLDNGKPILPKAADVS